MSVLSCNPKPSSGKPGAKQPDPVSEKSDAWAKARQMDLVPVWGETRISGQGDLSGVVKVFSDGARLNIRVSVRDDDLVLADDPVNCDHVELWFALPELAGTPAPDYYSCAGDDSRLLYWMIEPEKGAYRVDSALLLGALENSLYGYEGGGIPKKIRVEKVFFGITHLALYPDGRQAVTLDREFYRGIKELGMGDPASWVKYKAKKTDGGYEVIASVPAEAMAWVPGPEVSEVLWLCDVVDVDSVKQESVLSSSPRRKWASPSSFAKFALEKPIRVNLDSADADAASRILGQRCVWYLSGEGWKPCYFECGPTWYMGDMGWPAADPCVAFVNIETTKVQWKTDGDLRVATVGADAGYWVKGRFLASCADPGAFARAFFLPNGDPGLFLMWVDGPSGSPGMCGAAPGLGMGIWTGHGDKPEGAFYLYLNDCMAYLSISPSDMEDMFSQVSKPVYLEEAWSPPGGWQGTPMGDFTDVSAWPLAYRLDLDAKGVLQGFELLIIGSPDMNSQEKYEVRARLDWKNGKLVPTKVSEEAYR